MLGEGVDVFATPEDNRLHLAKSERKQARLVLLFFMLLLKIWAYLINDCSTKVGLGSEAIGKCWYLGPLLTKQDWLL